MYRVVILSFFVIFQNSFLICSSKKRKALTDLTNVIQRDVKRKKIDFEVILQQLSEVEDDMTVDQFLVDNDIEELKSKKQNLLDKIISDCLSGNYNLQDLPTIQKILTKINKKYETDVAGFILDSLSKSKEAALISKPNDLCNLDLGVMFDWDKTKLGDLGNDNRCIMVRNLNEDLAVVYWVKTKECSIDKKYKKHFELIYLSKNHHKRVDLNFYIYEINFIDNSRLLVSGFKIKENNELESEKNSWIIDLETPVIQDLNRYCDPMIVVSKNEISTNELNTVGVEKIKNLKEDKSFEKCYLSPNNQILVILYKEACGNKRLEVLDLFDDFKKIRSKVLDAGDHEFDMGIKVDFSKDSSHCLVIAFPNAYLINLKNCVLNEELGPLSFYYLDAIHDGFLRKLENGYEARFVGSNNTVGLACFIGNAAFQSLFNKGSEWYFNDNNNDKISSYLYLNKIIKFPHENINFLDESILESLNFTPAMKEKLETYLKYKYAQNKLLNIQWKDSCGTPQQIPDDIFGLIGDYLI